MFASPIFHPLTSPLLIAFLAATLWPTSLNAQDYKKGDLIEYKVGGAVPTRWERGIVIRPLDGGRQYLIHEKPSEFFPDGPEVAYAPADLRPLALGKKPDADPKAKPAAPIPAPLGTRPTDPLLPPRTKVEGEGLLSEQDVLAYAKKVFGSGDPFRVKNRDVLLDQIRDYIKARGTNFVVSATGEFYKKMDAQGTNAIRIVDAINANHGPAPQLDDYCKTFLMRVANRGSKSTTKEGTKVVIAATDEQHETGELTINKDGTYVWKLFRKDPEHKWLKGKWREAKPDEMVDYEGGPAIWLEISKGGFDSMVRMSRTPDYRGWIDVGWGKGRTPVEYGRPK